MTEASTLSLSETSSVLEFWKEFDLDGKRVELDQQCLEMRDLKTASITGRKKLNELTKLFRSRTKEEQLNQLTDILKAYQEEIDQLSRRSKFSESSFYALYKSIQEAPDPAVTIEALTKAVNSSSAHQFEVERLKAELSQYEEEFQQLKNQDITIRRLEDQLAEFREQIEDKVAEEVATRVAEVELNADSRIHDIREQQRAAERRLAAAVEAMKQAQQSSERAQNQLFDMSSQAEVRLSALSAENSILAEGAERALARAVELEGELESVRGAMSALQLRLSGSGSSGGSSGGLNLSFDGASALDVDSSSSVRSGGGEESQTLHMMVAELRLEIRKKEDSARSEKQKLDAANRELSQQLAKERESLSRARQELAERPTKEDLSTARRQLKLLQRVVFNVHDEDEDDLSSQLDPEHTADESMQLEILLSTRLKSLETELADVRRALSESQQSEMRNIESIATLRKSAETSALLIARLEMDLEHQTATSKRSSSGLAAGSRPSGDSKLSGARRGQLPRPYANKGFGGPGSSVGGGSGGDPNDPADGGSMELSELLGVDLSDNGKLGMPAEMVKPAHGGLSVNTKEGADAGPSSMVHILQAQRDRYKERLGQAEGTIIDLQQQVQAAQAAKMQLEVDNLALFEKMRYLECYGSGQRPNQGVKSMRIGGSNAVAYTVDDGAMMSMRAGIPGLGMRDRERYADDGEGEVVDKYRQLYEQRMNPFEEFSLHERQRKLQELSVGDRIILNTVMAIVSSKVGRSMLMFYFGTMHLLVFVILYYNAHYVHYGCDPSLDHHVA